MIALAAGAITEFQFGMVCVRTAADSAFAGIRLAMRFGFGLFGGALKINNVAAVPVSALTP